ncbi:MAG TPA: lysoplasmalogenase [Actinomycetota bacterium]|nr:lysoplasmalogenase [Actinomycetota bacterium]
MTEASWILLAAAAACAGLDWIAVARRDERLEYVFKPLALVALVGVAATLEPVHADQRRWFVVALLLSLGGDVFLMLPDRFLPGLAAFLGAHLAYVAGLLPHTGSFPQAWSGALGVAAIAAFMTWLVLPGVRARSRTLVLPVVGYVVVISLMVASAGATLNPVAAAGALAFFASDGLIAYTRFVHPQPWAPVTIMVTYHLGQALLVLSLAYGWT